MLHTRSCDSGVHSGATRLTVTAMSCLQQEH